MFKMFKQCLKKHCAEMIKIKHIIGGMIAMQGRLSTHDTGIAHYWPPAANPFFHEQWVSIRKTFAQILRKKAKIFAFVAQHICAKN